MAHHNKCFESKWTSQRCCEGTLGICQATALTFVCSFWTSCACRCWLSWYSCARFRFTLRSSSSCFESCSTTAPAPSVAPEGMEPGRSAPAGIEVRAGAKPTLALSNGSKSPSSDGVEPYAAAPLSPSPLAPAPLRPRPKPLDSSGPRSCGLRRAHVKIL